MEQIESSASSSIENKCVVQIEKSINLEDFYKNEAKFLNHLYSLEKRKAQAAIRETIQSVVNYSFDNKEYELKYYLIALSGIIARHMREEHLPVEIAFSFNSMCTKLIEEKLRVENVADVADELIELYLYITSEKVAPSLMHHTVNKVVTYIDDKIKSPMSVEGLSQIFDVSTSHLSRIFREHTGITLVEYINIKKVEDSQYYLRFSNEKISNISNQFNFCNQSYYTRVFKKYTGETPRRFRNQIGDNYFRFILSEQKV